MWVCVDTREREREREREAKRRREWGVREEREQAREEGREGKSVREARRGRASVYERNGTKHVERGAESNWGCGRGKRREK